MHLPLPFFTCLYPLICPPLAILPFQMSPFLYPKLLSSVIFRVKHTRSVLLSLYNVCGALCSELHVFQWTGTVRVGNEAVTLEAAVNPNAAHTCITAAALTPLAVKCTVMCFRFLCVKTPR